MEKSNNETVKKKITKFMGSLRSYTSPALETIEFKVFYGIKYRLTIDIIVLTYR